jgi:hypothetical protein
MSNQIYDNAVDHAAKELARDVDDQLLMSILGWHGMSISSGTVYGSRYHTVAPVWNPDRPMGFNNNWDQMMTWCVETFGPTAPIWGDTKTPIQHHRWYANNSKFWFKNEEDLTLFLLRWS